MAEKKITPSISDASVPNAGRIYDYVLGGNHNFEVDRKAAEKVLAVLPNFRQVARLIRWFIQVAVEMVTADGFTRFVDFASGLPTMDHIHLVAPKGTKVIYSDIDPVTVSYGLEIITGHPDARYFACDFATPENLLRLPKVAEHLGGSRKVVFGVNGIAWLVTDEQLRHAMQVLYDWAEKGSRLFICDADTDMTAMTPTMREVLKLYEDMREPFYIRSNETLRDIIHPWKVREPGFRTLEDWSIVQAGVTEQTLSDLRNRFVGAILEK
jgi:hypothetical protein